MTLNRRKELKRTAIKRVQPKRDWKRANAKVADKPCRNCGSWQNVQRAHTYGRKEQDETRRTPKGDKVLVVSEHSIVPLCGPSPGYEGCHMRYDARRLSLEGKLTAAELRDLIRTVGKGRARHRIKGGVDD